MTSRLGRRARLGYLMAIIDCCTREIVAWQLELRCRADEAIAARRTRRRRARDRAGRARRSASDNGSAFTARRFRARLAELGIRHRRGGYRDPEIAGLHRELVRETQRTGGVAERVRDPRRRPRAGSAATSTATTTARTRASTTGRRSRCGRPGRIDKNYKNRGLTCQHRRGAGHSDAGPAAPTHAMSTCVSISVVIAAHNEEDVLGRCLDALLRLPERTSSRSWSCATGAPIGPRTWRGGTARSPCDRNARSLQDCRAEPWRRCRLGLSAVLCRCGRHAPARIGTANRRAPRRGRCAGGVAGHGPRSARVEPGCPRLLPDLDAAAVCSRGHDRRRCVRALGGGPATLRGVPRCDRRRRVRPHAVRLGRARSRRRCARPRLRAGGLSDLVRIKTRSRLGRYELRQRFPELVARERTTKSYRNAMWTIVVRPWLWPAAVVLRGCPRRDSSSRPHAVASIGDYVWERDQSSRRPDRR